MTTAFRVVGGSPIRGTATVPGDKSISHRALLIAALGDGRSLIRNLSTGHDLLATRRLVQAMGAVVTDEGVEVQVRPAKVHGGQASTVDCGNSGTTMRLGAGALTRARRTTLLHGDASLSARPMARVLDPLCCMGARAWSLDGHAPIVVQGGDLHGIDFTPSVASAQVKGALLLAGLAADGETIVREPVATRAHTEEMLRDAGVDVTVAEGWVRVRPSSPTSLDLDIPGDPSAAAFWVVAASIVPGSQVRLEGVYGGPGRDGFIAILERMGADISLSERGPHLFDLEIRSAELRGTDVADPVEIAAAVDELPAIAVAAAFATGTTVIKGAQELRVKESDRLRALATCLTAVGAKVEEAPDGLMIEGSGPRGLRGGRIDAGNDHRIAMAMAVAGTAADNGVEIDGWESVRTSDPGFEEQLMRLRAA